jgi:hypothetical protein
MHGKTGEGYRTRTHFLISGSKYLTLIYIVRSDGLNNLRFNEMADTDFCHDGNRHGLNDLVDKCRITLLYGQHFYILNQFDTGAYHAGYTAVSANVGWNAFQRHDGACSGFFCYASLNSELSADCIHSGSKNSAG